MSITKLLSSMSVIFMMVALGFFAKKKQMISDEAVVGISALVVNITNPLLILNAAIQYEGRLDVTEFVTAFLWCALVFGILIVASYIIPPILRMRKDQNYAYKMLMVYGNTGYIGLPVCRALFGNDSVVYVTLFNVLFSLIVYTYGIGILKRAKRQQDIANGLTPAQDRTSLGATLRKICNVGTLSGLLAIVIYLMDPAVPEPIAEVVSYVGEPTIFLSMIVLGSSVASAPLGDYIHGSRKLAIFFVVRMILFPIVMSMIMRQVITGEVLLGTLTVLMSLPGGNLPLIMCKEMGLDDTELSKGIVLSTVVCLVTIPIVCLFL